jgi:hypothetical protein
MPAYYFAEGSTVSPMQTCFFVLNPTGSTANVTFTFQPEGARGRTVGPTAVPPMSRFSLLANSLFQGVPFATRIDSDQSIVAERSMYEGAYGDTGPALTPQQTWLFADGSTVSPSFDTFMLLNNPDPSRTTPATITYHKNDGSTATQNLTLPPISRTTVDVGSVVPNTTFTAQVTSQLPIVVEESEVLSPGTTNVSPSVVDGAPSPSTRWFIGEATVTTGQAPQPAISFTSNLLVYNPQTSAVSATVKCFPTSGNPITLPQMTFQPGQTTVSLNRVPELYNSAFGIQVDASSPIVVQRQIIFGSGTQQGLFNTLGATVAKNQWLLAEGSTQPPNSEILYILNPNPQPMSAQVTFFYEGRGAPQVFNFTVQPNTLLPIDVNSIFPTTNHGTQVVTNQPAIVERQMFFQKDASGAWGGTDAIGYAP